MIIFHIFSFFDFKLFRASIWSLVFADNVCCSCDYWQHSTFEPEDCVEVIMFSISIQENQSQGRLDPLDSLDQSNFFIRCL